MIKMIQILKYLKAQGLDLDEVMNELHEIMDNGQSQYFELTDSDIVKVTNIFHDEKKFDSVLNLVYLN